MYHLKYLKPKHCFFIFSLSLNLFFFVFYLVYFDKKIEFLSDNKDKVANLKNVTFHSGLDFVTTGKYHNEANYNRLPQKFKKTVRPIIWKLSQNSSGIQIRFNTNSPEIVAKWKISKNSEQLNMSKTGTSGIDLYCLVNGKWQFVNTGLAAGINNTYLLISDMDTISKEFLINLPLYNKTESLEIGIKKGFHIKKGNNNIKSEKPIVFYGTSITQGGSASRPGMSYPTIIGRNLNVEVLNMGFSGNGIFEESIGNVLCEIDSKLIVLDCTPNSNPNIIKKNTLQLIQQIRKCHTTTPILLVESITREYSNFKKTNSTVFGSKEYILAQNKELQKSYLKALSIGIKDIHYLNTENLIGFDHDATVDGTHLSDLGHYRLARNVQKKIIEILKK